MLRTFKTVISLALFGCLLAGFVYGTWTASHKTPSTHQAERADETKRHAKPVTPAAPVITDKANTSNDRDHNTKDKDWFTSFFEVKLTDLLIAIFTGVLAWKTAGLFRETAGLRTAADKQGQDFIRSIEASEKSATAAHKSAEALTQSERAHLFVQIINNNVDDVLRSDRNAGLPKDAVLPEMISVQFFFSNHGKTPAVVKAICRDVAYWSVPPEWDEGLTGNLPVIGLPAERDRIIDQGKEVSELRCDAKTLRKFQAESIIRRHTYFWFYGRVIYDDIFGAEHEHRFLFRRDKDGRLRAFHHPDYSKNT